MEIPDDERKMTARDFSKLCLSGRPIPRTQIQLCECCKTAFVDPGLYVAVAHALRIYHRRCDITVSHPLLKGADVD
jgi:hypothetical protein